jgi:hypothetical protein
MQNLSHAANDDRAMMHETDHAMWICGDDMMGLPASHSLTAVHCWHVILTVRFAY